MLFACCRKDMRPIFVCGMFRSGSTLVEQILAGHRQVKAGGEIGFLPALARSSIQQVSLECVHSHVPPQLMALLKGKDVMVGVIDVASDQVETPEEVADTIGLALQYVPREHLIACTNCGLAPMNRELALKKLKALARGAELARQRQAAG